MDIPEKYSLLKEHNHTFELHDSTDNTSFHVAKKELHPATQIKLMKMKKYSEGGDVNLDLPQDFIKDTKTPEAYDYEKMYNERRQNNPGEPQDVSINGTLDTVESQKNTRDNLKNSEAIDAQNKSKQASSEMQRMQSLGIAPPQDLSNSAAAMPQAQPSAQQRIDPSQVAMPQAQAPQQPGMNINPMADLEQANALQMQGAKEQAQAKIQESQGLDKIYGDQINQFQKMTQDHQARLDQLNQKSDELFKGVLNNQIDPNEYWKTHSKVSAGLGLILSGMGSGLTGQPNLAVKAIDDGINRDISAQRDNMGQKNNLYKLNMEKYHNENEAYLATKSDMLTMTAARAQQMAYKIGTPMAMAQLHQLQGQITQTKAAMHMQMAGMQVARQAYTQGIPPQAVSMLPESQQKLMVQLPDGNMAMAANEKAAEKYIDQTGSYNTLIDQLNTLKSLNTAGSALSPAARARSESLIGTLTIGLNDFAQSHRISESDIGFQKGQMSDPRGVGKFLSTDWNAATNQLIQSLTQAHAAHSKMYVPAIGNMATAKSKAVANIPQRPR